MMMINEDDDTLMMMINEDGAVGQGWG